MSRRSSGQLPQDILDALASRRRPLTVQEITDIVGGTSSGAVDQALKKLVTTGEVVCHSRIRPRQFALRTTAPATPAAPVIPVTRPGGQSYHPRHLAGSTDIEVLRQLRTANVPVLLYGPPGTGKTSLAEAAHTDLITVAGDSDTVVGDLVGDYSQNPDGSFTFTHGPLVTAMREGRGLFIDDATLIPPPVLAVLYPAMDGRGTITIKAHKSEQVTAAPGFYVMAGHNPNVHGAILTDALASRFSVHIHVTTDYDLARRLKVPTAAITVAKNLASRAEAGEISWAPQLRELLAFRDIAGLLGMPAAAANLVSIAPPADRDVVAEVTSRVCGTPVTALSLGSQITHQP